MTPWKRTLACAFVAQILAIVGFSFCMPFLPFFIAELGVRGTAAQTWWAGIVMSATGVTLAIFAPLWGYLADRYGRRLMVMRAMFVGSVV
ncbi:MAG: MFS transporter, partial [Kiritimatiellae bacterium]|nr:MFS transporter [Kiritimatiellia bacterium]